MLDPKIIEGPGDCPVDTTLGIEPTMQKRTNVIHPLANEEGVAPNGVSVGCSALPSKVILPCDRGCTVSSFAFGGGGGVAYSIYVLLMSVTVAWQHTDSKR